MATRAISPITDFQSETYRQISNISGTLVGNKSVDHSIRWSWSIACRLCSNCIFILDSTPGFNGLGKDNRKTRRETYELWDFGAPYIRDLTVYPSCFLQVLSYDGWKNIYFIGGFLLSCGMGFVLMSAIVVCTQVNSALTTNIIGVLKVRWE